MTPEQSLTWELRADFENEPLEDGMAHPAEETLARRLTREREDEWLPFLERICRDEDHPALAASTLKCLGRLDRRPWTPGGRAMLVRQALAAQDMQIRNAGAQAAEHWDGEPRILEELQQHSDPEEWMQEYVDGILRDWGHAPGPGGEGGRRRMRKRGQDFPQWAKWALGGGLAGSAVGIGLKIASIWAVIEGNESPAWPMMLAGETIGLGSIAAAMAGVVSILVWKIRQERDPRTAMRQTGKEQDE